MDSSVLTQLQSLLKFWYLIPLVLLVTILRSPWFKGHLGEFIVNVSARLFLDKDRYHLIKNVTLPTEDGTTQIDHIIVCSCGVFVVETKNTQIELCYLEASLNMAQCKKSGRAVIRRVDLSGDKQRQAIRQYGVAKWPGLRERGVSNGFFEWNHDSCRSFIS